LHRLSFATLPDSTGAFLIDRYELYYLPTGRQLLNYSSGHVEPSGPPAVFGAPDFGPYDEEHGEEHGEERGEAQPLKHAEGEGTAIAKKLGVQSLSGKAATALRIKSCVSPVILHIATHGFYVRGVKDFLASQGFPQVRPDHGRGRLLHPADEQSRNPLLRSALALAGVQS
jgi:CHAT domain-containing protein